MADGHLELSKTQTLRVVGSAPAALEMESTWKPGGSPPPTHWHPHQHEHFAVLEGVLTVRLGGESPRRVEAGETIDVPARTAHSMWNAGTVPCRASWRVTPARRTEEMLRTVAAGPGPLGKVRMLWRFRHEFRLGSPRRG